MSSDRCGTAVKNPDESEVRQLGSCFTPSSAFSVPKRRCTLLQVLHWTLRWSMTACQHRSYLSEQQLPERKLTLQVRGAVATLA